MPQYDAYEEPLPLPEGPCNPHVTGSEHSQSQTTRKPDLSERREDVITGSHDAMSHNDPFHSQMAYHGRHAHLGRSNGPGEKLVESIASPESPDAFSSPKILSEAEKMELAAIQKSQQEDDQIRMDLQSSARKDSDAGDREHARQHAGHHAVGAEPEAETKEHTRPWLHAGHHAGDDTAPETKEHTNKGGWMRRSRANSELLADNDVIRTDHDNYRL